jgi:hypothetical protein
MEILGTNSFVCYPLQYKDNTERCMNSSSVKSSMESAETLKTQSDVKVSLWIKLIKN